MKLWFLIIFLNFPHMDKMSTVTVTHLPSHEYCMSVGENVKRDMLKDYGINEMDADKVMWYKCEEMKGL